MGMGVAGIIINYSGSLPHSLRLAPDSFSGIATSSYCDPGVAGREPLGRSNAVDRGGGGKASRRILMPWRLQGAAAMD